MARMITSVILFGKNDAANLTNCLGSLAAQKSKYAFEVHLVVSSSTDSTYRLASSWLKEHKQKNFFVWREKKNSIPAARNYGAKKARGEILLFADADSQFSPQWVEEMSRPLLEPQHYPLVALSGLTEIAARNSNAPTFLDKYGDGILGYINAETTAFLPWAPAHNFSVRSEVFRECKGFEENWRTAAYDVDFCWRLALSGFVLGKNKKAKLQKFETNSLRKILRRIENYAYYHQSLLATYRRELKLPLLEQQKEKILGQGRRALAMVRSTKSLADAKFRGMDGLVSVALLKGALEARIKFARPNPKLSPTRRGLTPPALQSLLSRGYSHLHLQGWAYWKNPANLEEDGGLELFRPKSSERFQLESRAWRIWETKAEKGQSEDAAEASGEDPEDLAVLEKIDALTMDFHTRRLLP